MSLRYVQRCSEHPYWGAYYGDARMKGAKLDISKWNRPSPERIPSHAKAAGLYMICTMSKHAAEVTPVGQVGDYHFEVGELTRAIAEDYEKLVRGKV